MDDRSLSAFQPRRLLAIPYSTWRIPSPITAPVIQVTSSASPSRPRQAADRVRVQLVLKWLSNNGHGGAL
eukprot:116101-Hanusia_phi.AAC.1